jgi:ribosomal-protein-alanine N-acetyltransferase
MTTIRALGDADLAEAERIHLDAFGQEAWDREAILEILAMPGAGGLVAIHSDGIAQLPLGFALYLLVGPDAELLTLAVPHVARHRGVGRSLVEAFLAVAGGAGAINALLEVAEDNAIAQALYGSLGFAPSGRRKDYYLRPGNRRVAARLLRRPLP